MKRSSWHLGLFGMLAGLALSMVACGGPPPLEEIESNLDKPNVTISGAMIAKGYLSYDSGALATSLPTMGTHGKMISYLSAKRDSNIVPMKEHLKQSGLPSAVIEKIMPYLPVNNDMTIKKKYLNKGDLGVLQQAQTFGACVSGGLTGLSGSFSISVDLGCLGEGSGRITMNANPEYSIFDIGKGVAFKLEIRFDKACDKKNNCVDGAMIYKVGVVTGSEDSGVRLMLSMLLKISTEKGEQLEVKHGIRISLVGKTKSTRIEVLAYVKDDEDREHTIVLDLLKSDAVGTFAVRGKNGRFICKTADRGRSGTCFVEGKEATVAHKW